MISQARLDANRRNAKKSTGPRTEEGKRRSSLNAITHAMTARFALLPDEDEAAFDRRMFQWVQSFGPQDDGELFQAERAAYCSWLVQRARRAQSARLVFKAQTALDEKRNREDRESMELALRLFRSPGGGHADKGDNPGNSEQERDLRGASLLVERDEADHPALLVLGLEASESGCRWLLDRWNELKTVMESERLGSWQAPERFKAIRLLRLDARDVMLAPAVIVILQACQALDPDAGELVDEYWNELRASNPDWSIERLRAWVPEIALPADAADARQELAEIVKRETDRLEFKLKEHETINELEEKYSAHNRAFDHSPEGERMRRYETTCNRYVDRYFSELGKRKRNRSGEGYSPTSLTYARPRPQAFRQTEDPSESREKAELTAFIDSIRKREVAGASSSNGAGASSSKSQILNLKGGEENGSGRDANGPLQNEAKGAGASSSKSQILNLIGDEENGSGRDANGELQNEAKGAGASSSKSQILNLKGDEENGSGRDANGPLQNEAKGAGASSSKSQILNLKGDEENGSGRDANGELQNEANNADEPSSAHDELKIEVTPKQIAAAGTGMGGILRNEPKPAAGAGAHHGGWQPKAWDNSRRARRARESIGRSAGRRAVDCQAEAGPTWDDRVIATSPSD
jgi:hypothetical protein